MSEPNQYVCAICGKSFAKRDLVAGAMVRNSVAELIRRAHPEWSPEHFICRTDLTHYRSEYVRSLLESEKGELTSLGKKVLTSLRQHEILTTNIDAEFEQEWTFGERLADRIAVFGGSWTFLICFGVFLMLWIGMNSAVVLWRPVDPYPFILLNLVLSCLAASCRERGRGRERTNRTTA